MGRTTAAPDRSPNGPMRGGRGALVGCKAGDVGRRSSWVVGTEDSGWDLKRIVAGQDTGCGPEGDMGSGPAADTGSGPEA